MLSPNPSSSLRVRGQGSSFLTRESLGGVTPASLMAQPCIAGDKVKFGFPRAFTTTTMLSWSVVEFGGVGDAEKDHACRERLEDMETPTSVFKVDKNNPGSDVAEKIAAALAAASLVFKKTDPAYSKTLVRRAIRFADKYRGPYSNGLKPIVCPFYCSYSGYQDELLWGAAWLHKATKNLMCLNYIKVNGQTLGVADFDNTFGWDDKHVRAMILLSKEFLVRKVQTLPDYKGHTNDFICSVIPGSSSTQFTPGELLFTYAEYLTKAHMVVNYGGTTVTPKRLRSIAKKQVDYLVGDNPLKMSYMVGHGPRCEGYTTGDHRLRPLLFTLARSNAQ
ncbi:Endoglucanase 17 [Spatholobus suberectus]|nr:Endoglucanase 17 [Spatholobus suberectus]